jgi:alpha-tubulin suppressor-like RCC1 family protein/sugar lactone lactonase YvrE
MRLCVSSVFFFVFLLMALMAAPRPANATIIQNGENAIDVLGQYNSYTADNPADYVNGCANDGAPYGFYQPIGGGIDLVNHWLFIADQGNNRVLVFTLTSGNLLTLANKTPAYVLGQPNFTTCAANNNDGSPTQSSLSAPTGSIAVDSTNHLIYVADKGNNRVMVFSTSSMSNGENATYVLGQSSWTTGSSGTTSTTLSGPHGVAVDVTHSLLYVADSVNNRVMVYATPVSTGEAASYELGQSSSTTATAATTQPGLHTPTDVAIDPTNQKLYVADSVNNRVMVFPTSSLATGENASFVIGQTGFTTATTGLTQSTLSAPQYVTVDTTNSRVFVADMANAREMIFPTPVTANGENASFVIGAPNFVTNAGGVYGAGGQNFFQNNSLGPSGAAYDSTNNLLYLTDYGNNRVMIFNVAAPPSSTVVTQGGEDACDIAGGNLYCWGVNTAGEDGVGNTTQYLSPQQVTSVSGTWTSISEGNYDPGAPDTCGIVGGALYCWGCNCDGGGELGLGNTTQYTTPQHVSSVSGTWTTVTQSGGDGCGTLSTGALYCWGGNWFGEDGVGNTTAYESPVQVTSPSETWSTVSNGNAGGGGGADTCGITTGGALYCWGWNGHGEDGLGNIAQWTTPQQVGVGAPSTSWSVPTQGGQDGCAINAGNLYCWGWNGNGEDGLGNTTQYTTPQKVTSVTGTWTAVSTGIDGPGDPDTCGIVGGALYCWGRNGNGEDGVGNTTQYTTPQHVTSVSGTWSDITQTGIDACGILSTGALYCWGYNTAGEDGVGTTTQYTTPQNITSPSATWSTVSNGWNGHNGGDTCAITTGGALYCWGLNTYGEAGVGNTTQYTTPQQVGNYNTVFLAATSGGNLPGVAGAAATCQSAAAAAGLGGTYYAWISDGTNSPSSGTYAFTHSTVPYKDVNGNTIATSWTNLVAGTLTAGIKYTASGTLESGVDVWTNASTSGGSTSAGSGSTTNCSAWTLSSGGTKKGYYGTSGATGATWTASGSTATCSTAAYLYCFQQDGGNSWTSVNQGGDDTCAITTGGKLYCWGQNAYGELGVGNTTEYKTPVQVGTATNWTAISIGGFDGYTGGDGLSASDACGIAGGNLYCWGQNHYGEDGLGNTAAYSTPQQVTAISGTWTAVNFGSSDTCGINGGQLYCWGQNNFGEDGLGTTTQYTTPQTTNLINYSTTWASVSQGANDTCAITTGGQLYCWGYNNEGELGLGNNTQYTTPQEVTPTSGLVGWWKLIDGSGTSAADSSNSGHTGTLQNAPTWATSGPNGGGLTLNGTSQYVTTSVTNLMGTGAGTFSAWLYPTSTTGGPYFYQDGYTGMECQIWSGLFACSNNTSTFASTAASAQANQWQLFTAVRNSSGQFTLYVNGVLSGTANQSAGTVTAGTLGGGFGAVIGNATNGGAAFPGTIADVHVYNTALTAAQVGELYKWTAISVQNSNDDDSTASDACGIAGGNLYCWGQNEYGEDGLGNTTAYSTPQQVTAIAGTWSAVSFTGYDTCGINSSNLYCWGYNNWGEDGLGNTTQHSTPQQVCLNSSCNNELATDLIGQYNNMTPTTPVSWTENGANNGPNALGFFSNVYTQSAVVALDGVHHYMFVADTDNNRVLVYTLNPDNSIPSASGGHTATYALGQTSLQGVNSFGAFPSGMGLPNGLAVDSANQRLFVAADGAVIIYNTSSLSTGMSASNYLAGGVNTSANSLYNVGGIAYDAVNSRLFVADTYNNRVLVFNVLPSYVASQGNGYGASYVLGQTSFTASTANQGLSAPTQSTLAYPGDVAFDPVNERLFVADGNNERVMVFNVAPATIANGENAAYVLGQSGFTSNSYATTQSGMYNPGGVAYDSYNNRLFVGDVNNLRVLVFNVSPGVISNGMNASYELGQPSGSAAFTTGLPSGLYNTAPGLSLTQSGLDGAARLYYDPASGHLFVGDDNNRVMIFPADNMPSWPTSAP